MERYQSFTEFYPFYLSQHQNPTCRRLHFIGMSFVCIFFVLFLFTFNGYWLLLMPVFGYGLAWIGHYLYEKNHPATFQYPLYSLMGDFVMFKDLLTGKIPL